MRVKIGNTWHEATPTVPIMIELTPENKALISQMAPEATRFAEFHKDMPIDVSAREDWMSDRGDYRAEKTAP